METIDFFLHVFYHILRVARLESVLSKILSCTGWKSDKCNVTAKTGRGACSVASSCLRDSSKCYVRCRRMPNFSAILRGRWKSSKMLSLLFFPWYTDEFVTSLWGGGRSKKWLLKAVSNLHVTTRKAQGNPNPAYRRRSEIFFFPLQFPENGQGFSEDHGEVERREAAKCLPEKRPMSGPLPPETVSGPLSPFRLIKMQETGNFLDLSEIHLNCCH